ncbi:hypothetical protein KH5H1_75540 [Corallococcus caeni]|nr:hypothetical protein KH5H1_75540 [Corallococcus sp. KH5-1]
MVVEDDGLAIWDIMTGQPRFRSSSDLEPGRVRPPDAWNPWPEDAARFIPTERGWDFTRWIRTAPWCVPRARGRSSRPG